ncbi:MAG: ATPase domain-containing protein [Candidatus Woesearchaeota archaeon]
MDLDKTGIPGLDEILKGGLRRNSSILVKGSPGSGKTILALQFIYAGAKKGEPGVFITAEEDLDDLRAHAKTLGMGLEDYEKKKLIFLVKQPVTLKKLISIATPLDLILKGKVKRVVMDSLTIFRYSTDDEMSYRKEILNLIENMKKVLFMATAEEKKTGLNNLGATAEDYLFDGVIRLIKIRRENNFERCIFVEKARGQDHMIDIYPFTITNKGLVVHPKEIPFSLMESEYKGRK